MFNIARDVALCPKLPLVPYIVWANSVGYGETAQICRLAGAFAVCLSVEQIRRVFGDN